MGVTLFFFLGALSCAAMSALFCVFGLIAGDRRLVQMTAVAAFICVILTLFLGSLL